MTSTVCMVVALGVAWYVWHENQRSPFWETYVFALKSGQSIFIRTPSDKRILIDGGTNSEIIGRISSILPFYSRRIDKIVVTKLDSKHVTGLVDVVSRYSVGEIIVPDISLQTLGLASSADQIYQAFIDVVNESGIPLKKTTAGDGIVFDDVSTTSPVMFEALFPMASSSFQYSNASAPELVGRISFGSTSIMLAGSITPKIQKFIATSTATLPSSGIRSVVLVLSQNASADYLTRVFVNAITPSYVIYSRAPSTLASKLSMVTAQKPQKEKTDPLVDIPETSRFNLREVGDVRIVFDGLKIISIQHP